jgi:hypothetical protein
MAAAEALTTTTHAAVNFPALKHLAFAILADWTGEVLGVGAHLLLRRGRGERA